MSQSITTIYSFQTNKGKHVIGGYKPQGWNNYSEKSPRLTTTANTVSGYKLKNKFKENIGVQEFIVSVMEG